MYTRIYFLTTFNFTLSKLRAFFNHDFCMELAHGLKGQSSPKGRLVLCQIENEVNERTNVMFLMVRFITLQMLLLKTAYEITAEELMNHQIDLVTDSSAGLNSE